MKRRNLLKVGLGLSAIPLISSLRVALSARAGSTDLPPTQLANSSNLLHNLRYEGLAVTTSALVAGSSFAQDSDLVKAHCLAVLNHGVYQQLRVRAGGHSYIGNSISKSAYVVNLAPFDRMEVDAAASTIKVGAGCRFFQVAERLAEIAPNAFIASGDCPTVGVTGYSLGGGVSLLSPVLGLGVDRVVRATMLVFAREGDAYAAKTLQISPTEHPELFWAAMGGGGQCGIITDITLRYEILEASSLYEVHVRSSSAEAFRDLFNDWEQLCGNQLDPTTSGKLQLDNFENVSISGVVRQQTGDLTHLQSLASRHGGSVDVKPLTLSHLYEMFAGCRALADCSTTAWTAAAEYVAAKSTMLERLGTLSASQLESIYRQVNDNRGADYAYIQWMRWNGAMNTANTAVCFPWRAYAYEVQVSAKSNTRSRWSAQSYDQWVDNVTAQLGTRTAAYYNHVNADIETQKELYFGKSWQMLQDIKRLYDPQRIFDIVKRADQV